jgi:FAD/FMN-containing dehydrogenase
VTTTGVGGFTLGGGYGWLSPKFGLACDNLLSAEVVTADGRLVTASEGENEDLLWGLRGGSGNFGVATSYEFRLHPIGPTVLAGLLVYPIEEARGLLRASRDYVASAPEELTTGTVILQAPAAEFIPAQLHGRPVLGVLVCYIGQPEEGGAVVAPLKRLGSAAVDLVAPMPYMAFQATVDPFSPRGCCTPPGASISAGSRTRPSTPTSTTGLRSPRRRRR